MHYPTLTLPAKVAAGVSREEDILVEKVQLVGGGTVRNQEAENPIRIYEVPFPLLRLDDQALVAVHELWKAVDGNTHTFTYYDEVDDENVRVRFEGKLRTNHQDGPFWQIDTLLLVEEREEP